MREAQIVSIDTERRERLTKEIITILDGVEKTWRVLGDKLLELRGTFDVRKGGSDYLAHCKQRFKKSFGVLTKYCKARELEVQTFSHEKKFPINDYQAVYEIATQPKEIQEEIVERIEEGWCPTRTEIKEQYPKASRTPRPPKPFDKQQEVAIEAEVSRRVKERVEMKIKEAAKIKRSYQQKARLLNSPMTRQEYQLVLSCLHPDKPDRDAERLKKAFGIVKRLEGLCND